MAKWLGELFEKSSPITPQKLFEKKKRTDGKNSPFPVRERTALFPRYYRELRGPRPFRSTKLELPYLFSF
jgi:hypothetical protein